jgi:hypothetical protein
MKATGFMKRCEVDHQSGTVDLTVRFHFATDREFREFREMIWEQKRICEARNLPWPFMLEVQDD